MALEGVRCDPFASVPRTYGNVHGAPEKCSLILVTLVLQRSYVLAIKEKNTSVRLPGLEDAC
jgi:hypothetical protein